MIYRVRHVTTYAYARNVELGSHLAHLLPRPIEGAQVVRSSTLATEPALSFSHEGSDHFGNRTAWLTIERPHRRFVVTASSIVDVSFPAPPPRDATPPWEEVASAARSAAGWDVYEFLLPSPKLPPSEAALGFAAPCFAPGTPLLDGLLALNAKIRRDFRFKAGVTNLATTVGELLASRQGVCQDFTHLMLSCLRALGLPARYTSGYIRTYPAPGKAKRPGSDVSHAWVGAWLGPGSGWIGLDPTNGIVVRDEHVVLGWGRDFSDVSPLYGVILGGGRHTLDVSVDLATDG